MKMSNNNFKERMILKFKRNWIRNNLMTIILIVLLFAIFISLNIWVQNIDLAQIDVTENKLYSLTESSKKMLKDINKDVKIYLFGFYEDSSIVDFAKQYCRENEKITYEILTEESNKEKVEELNLTSGDNYQLLIVEVGENTTILDANYDFVSYDYTTGQEVDLTEQAISNAILNLTVESKPKVYILNGHGEYNSQEIGMLSTYLGNEAYEYESLNLLSVSQIPEDCSLLLIMSPTSDLLENEVSIITDYINRGGNIILTKDTEENSKQYSNLQKVLDIYGISIENGYVYETNTKSTISGYPIIIMPTVSSYNEITSEIYSDGGYLVLPYAQKVNTVETDVAETLSVEYETILSSSSNSYYVSDVSADIYSAIATAEVGSSNIAVLATKTLGENEEETKQSKILVIGNGRFISDYAIEAINSNYPVSYLGNNKDFMLNSIASLTNRKDTLSIRKETNSSTYMPTAQQDIIVQIVIYGVPVLIILTGIIVWQIRKRKR